MSSRIRVNAKQPIPKPNGKTMKSDTDLSSFDVVTMFFHSFCPPQKEIMLFHCTTSHQMKVKWNTLISHRLCGHAMTDIHAMWKESSSIIYNPSSSIIITIIIIIIFIVIIIIIIALAQPAWRLGASDWASCSHHCRSVPRCERNPGKLDATHRTAQSTNRCDLDIPGLSEVQRQLKEHPFPILLMTEG